MQIGKEEKEMNLKRQQMNITSNAAFILIPQLCEN